MLPEQPSILPEPSAELLEAQARLLQLRARLGIEAKATPQPLAASSSQTVNWLRLNAERELQQRRELAGIGTAQTGVSAPSIAVGWGESAPPPGEIPHLLPAKSQTVVVHPTMLLAMLKQNLEAPGRVYFLLRALDTDGRGWLEIDHIRRLLTQKDSSWRICGWRRLRQLLREGEEVFWSRDDRDRLWLHGAHKIAHTLDCKRLVGFPILLPVSSLLGGIQAVRAAFYAAFHGGRHSSPISRQTLRVVSGVAERTQRVYDRLAQVQRQRNLAVGERYSQDAIQERAWAKGRAVFYFVDTKGLQGRAGRDYIAWNLPNSYQAAYQRRSRGSRKRLNRKLADLVNKGIPGNDDKAVEKLFFSNGALAAKRYNRDSEIDAYWQQEQIVRAGTEIWSVIAGRKKRLAT